MDAIATPPLELIHLASGTLRLDVAPTVGGAIARFCSEGPDGRTTEWLRPAGEAGLASRDPLNFSSFPLIPFCNRIRNGRSTYGDLPLQMPPNMPPQRHVIHGTSWHAPWDVESRSSDGLVLTQQHRPQGAHDWPYAFDARLFYRLSEEALHIEISATNRSEHRMPTGIGHHPYLPHRPGTRLTTRVSAMWASDAELLPTKLTEPPFLKEMAQGIELSRIVLDNNFVGWSREARVDWPDEGTALVMRAEAPLDFFVLYSPAGQDHFCMEPVSNCTDWMNLAQQGIGPVGGTMLAPGETLVGRFELRPIVPAQR